MPGDTTDTKDEKPKLTPLEIEEAVRTVRDYAALKREHMQAIIDGAILGAEQVQDKRLEILEKSPEVTVNDVLFNIFIVFCLESTISGWVVTKVTRSVIGPILRSNAIYQLFPGSLDRQKVAEQIQHVRQFLGKGSSAVSKDLSSGAPDYLRYRRYLASLARGSQEENMVAAVKTAWDSSKTPVKAGPSLAPTDSPGVSVLQAAQNFISQQRFALSLETDFFEMLVRSCLLEPEELKDLSAALVPDSLGISVIDLRDRMKLIFEAMIWSRLYDFQKRNMKTSLLNDMLTGDARDGIEGLDNPALINYWKRRFGKLIEEWTQANPGYFKFWGKYPIQSYEHLDSPESQLEYLLLFFKFFPDKMPEITKAINTGYREKKK